MSDKSRIRSWASAALASAALTAASAAMAADPPLPDSGPATVRVHGDEDLDVQLEAAREELEHAAHDVARLSSQISGTVIDRVMPFDEPDRAIIGVQLEPGDGASGARVREVSPGGPAAEAGIHAGDAIVAINGIEIKGNKSARQVVALMRDVKPDSKVSVRVLREGKTHDFTVIARHGPMVLAAGHRLPDMGFMTFPPAGLPGNFLFHGPLTDMELVTLTPRLGSYFGSDKGVLVVRAPTDGAMKLEDGDVILAIDGRQPTSGSHATRILGSYQPGEKVTLRIMREHKNLDVETTLPERPAPLHKEIEHHLSLPSQELQPRKLVILGGGDSV